MDATQTPAARERAIVFVDGANFYHRLCEVGVVDPNRLDLRRVAKKLAQAREVVEIRYYLGKVTPKSGGAHERIKATQQRLLSALQKQGVMVCFGRLEHRTEENELAKQLLSFLGNPPPEVGKIEQPLYKRLYAMANTHRKVEYWVEKAVDTQLAVDVARMALDDKYDVAYILSKDGDMVPGVDIARKTAKKRVFAAGTADHNYAIKNACEHYIVLSPEWLTGCYLVE